MKPRVTVREASVITGRSVRTIYRWIDTGQLDAERDGANELTVNTAELMQIETQIKPGRPRIQQNAQ